MTKNASKSTHSEVNENEFEKTLSTSIPMPQIRLPLTTIPDPTQFGKDNHEADHESKEKSEASVRAAIRPSDRKIDSATTTPARYVTRNAGVGPGASFGAYSGNRGSLLYSGGRGGSSSRVLRGVSTPCCEPSPTEVQHFELVEDPSFWNDHNVQVLIRMRPISQAERISQGYGRCLRQESSQTLLWLGHPEMRFTFDHIASETISQERLFRVAGMPMVDNCMSGYNSCMFAYGQTGSGKTYTMMGEISQTDGMLSEDCGITPRLFEYLFARIKEQEENRRDERLKYSCKCSFLEIYNEQITDLLEPSSTNLQLREDLKKGVYVENLMEYNVRTVDDVLKLLLQGAANRKVAGTNMNSESSRSHSVFTCIIESHWEKDSMTHLRFGRLNLVDLAGSERQKSSGAEGDRLKEAANINKSLSTLGLVIMSLVDLAHGKHRHVPYRDSRLTFLLQDSLGGNSKTTIIANVSPSICSANETLSTLKFAQRAKLIQNNAKINEDASGDVTALQRQVQVLKGQLSLLLKHHNISRSLSHHIPSSQPNLGDSPMRDNPFVRRHVYYESDIPNDEKRKTKSLKATLVGALRRERSAETTARMLEAQIEQMNRLAFQREEEVQRTKMMLKFREEKIKRLELLADDLISADKYLMDENKALTEEIQLLRARIDRNPEVTRFALENIRLLEQLRLFEDFYEQGEREKLLAEVSSLRDQLLEILEGKESCMVDNFPSKREDEDGSTAKELEECKNMNSKHIREVDELRSELSKFMINDQAAIYPVDANLSKDREEFKGIGKNSEVQTTLLRADSFEGNQLEDGAQQKNDDQRLGNAVAFQSTDTGKDLIETRILLEAMESEQVRLIEELDSLRQENDRLIKIIRNTSDLEREVVLKLDNRESQDLPLEIEDSKHSTVMDLQVKLDQMTKDLEDARVCSTRSSQQQINEQQIDLVREEVEMETANTIIHLQEEVAALQEDMRERLCSMAEENIKLRDMLIAKEDEIGLLHSEWERASLELTSFLLDGSKSLRDASRQIESIACSFPRHNVWVGEHVKKAAKVCLEKEETILHLQRNLEDAQKMVQQMEQKLNSLRGATMALTEVQQIQSIGSTTKVFGEVMGDKINEINFMCKEDKFHDTLVEGAAHLMAFPEDNLEGDIPVSKVGICYRREGECVSEMVDVNTKASDTIDSQVLLSRLGLMETENAFNMVRAEAETYLSTLQTDIHKACSLYRDLVLGFLKEINEMRKNLVELKENNKTIPRHRVEIPSQQACGFFTHEQQQIMRHEIMDELAKTNSRLNVIRASIHTIMKNHGSTGNTEDSERWSTDCSTQSSNFSDEVVASNDVPLTPSYRSCSESPFEATGHSSSREFERGSLSSSGNQESEKLERAIKSPGEKEITLLCLKKEFKMAYDGFIKLNVQLASLFGEKDFKDHSQAESVEFVNSNHLHAARDGHKQPIKQEMHILQPSEFLMQEAQADCSDAKKFVADEKVCQVRSFFTKFEEASTTMNEADVMLNALLKANESAKTLTGLWKQTGKELMAEKASLIDEIVQLKSYIRLRDEENEILQDQSECSLQEVAHSVSLLESSFLQMQRNAEDLCTAAYSDALTMAQNFLQCILKSRSSLQDICAENMEKKFASFVLQRCRMGQYVYQESGLRPSRLQERIRNHLETRFIEQSNSIANEVKGEEKANQSAVTEKLEACDSDDSINESLKLKKELERKDVILDGLLFDFSLLQESASTRQDIKEETDNLILELSKVRAELNRKTSQLDDMLVQHRLLEGRLADTETALCASSSDLKRAKEALDVSSFENADLRSLLEDIYLKKSEVEEQLEEQREVVRTLENQILSTSASSTKQLLSSLEGIEDDLRKVSNERDQLREQVISLQDTLDMAYALADENDAIAVEARQESEASKLYAEQKEEEVKILEHSVEELDSTINVLERKVYEMEEEVERHRMIRDSLELELQALNQRLLTFETYKESMESEYSNSEQQSQDQLSRKLRGTSVELHEAQRRIRVLEDERAEQAKEIKQCKDYISELVLHAEAQASQYQHKYKTLEAMIREVKTEPVAFGSEAPIVDRTEKSSARARGSSSPFRCITNLVQQMNTEKDQELSLARLHIEELDALAASRQKEICMLNARLAAAESMTHDVIRDLLGVKMDMTNYADLIDQYQLQRLVDAAQQQTEESVAMEQEIIYLRRKINDLLEERERCISEVHRKEADILATQMTVEQLQERDQLLTAQNEMLKMDKTNLQRRAAELDDMVKKLLGRQSSQPRNEQQPNNLLRPHNADFSKRLAHSEKLLFSVNDELARYRDISDGRGSREIRFRK